GTGGEYTFDENTTYDGGTILTVEVATSAKMMAMYLKRWVARSSLSCNVYLNGEKLDGLGDIGEPHATLGDWATVYVRGGEDSSVWVRINGQYMYETY